MIQSIPILTTLISIISNSQRESSSASVAWNKFQMVLATFTCSPRYLYLLSRWNIPARRKSHCGIADTSMFLTFPCKIGRYLGAGKFLRVWETSKPEKLYILTWCQKLERKRMQLAGPPGIINMNYRWKLIKRTLPNAIPCNDSYRCDSVQMQSPSSANLCQVNVSWSKGTTRRQSSGYPLWERGKKGITWQ